MTVIDTQDNVTKRTWPELLKQVKGPTLPGNTEKRDRGELSLEGQTGVSQTNREEGALQPEKRRTWGAKGGRSQLCSGSRVASTPVAQRTVPENRDWKPPAGEGASRPVLCSVGSHWRSLRETD